MDTFWLRIKPSVTGFVVWSRKNHWLLLLVLLGTQYVTGKHLSGDWSWVSLERGVILGIHSLLGALLFLLAIILSIQKIYLWLLRSGRL